MPLQDAIIVGAGISGMSLAHYISKNGLKPLVIDKNGRLGGSFNSYRKDNFWFELGAHSCYNSYGNLVDLLTDTGCLDKIIKPGSAGYKLFTGGEIKSIMSQMSFLELAVSLPRLFGTKMDGETVESYYSAIMGKNNFEKAMGPMFNAVICQSANAFPADMLFKKRERRKEVLKKFSLSGGIQTIIDSVAAAPAIETVTGKEATEIMFDSDLFKVTTSDGSSYESKRLALATSSEVAAKMLQKSFPEISKKLVTLKAEHVDTVGVIIKKDATKIGPVAALAATDDIFYSFVSRDTFPDPLFRAFAFHFKAGVASHETKLGRIAQVLGTREFEQVATAEHVIPSLRLGHKNTIAEIDGMLRGTSLLLTGNYFTGLAIEDCVSRSLQEYRRLTN